MSASPDLLRVLIRQNEEALRRLLATQPWDHESPDGREHFRQIDELRAQTLSLGAALDDLQRNPPPPRRRRTWRDLPPPSAPLAR